MKLVANLFVLLTSFFTAGTWAVAYDDDEQNFWVEGQVLNETLSSVNFLLCITQAMRPDAFVNASYYIATLYPQDCETSGADGAADKASATATSSKSSTTAKAGGAAASKAKPSISGSLLATRADSSSPVISKGWIAIPPKSDDYDPEPAMRIYLSLDQTAGASSASPNGDFKLIVQERTDSTIGNIYGYDDDTGFMPNMLISQGNTMLFDAGYDEKISVEYLDNGDKRGVFFQTNQFIAFALN